jgi:hypothetical protein
MAGAAPPRDASGRVGPAMNGLGYGSGLGPQQQRLKTKRVAEGARAGRGAGGKVETLSRLPPTAKLNPKLNPCYPQQL